MIATRYAAALLGFAKKENQLEEVYAIAKSVAANFVQFPKLRAALEHPMLTTDKKRQLILTATKPAQSAAFERFVSLVLANGREAYLHSMMLKFADLYRAEKNIFSGKLTTAYAVDALTEKQLIAIIESRNQGQLEIEKVIDPAILGGFMLEIDNTRWDASMKRQLQTIKNELNF